MGVVFWLRRYMLVFCIAFAVIFSAHFLRGHPLAFSLAESGLWAMISAFIFVIARRYQSSRGQHCALCNDISESSSGNRPKRI